MSAPRLTARQQRALRMACQSEFRRVCLFGREHAAARSLASRGLVTLRQGFTPACLIAEPTPAGWAAYGALGGWHAVIGGVS